MTACANKNEGKALSGKKAVSATLAGVLAVGMVPAAALATEGGEAAEDAGIDLLVAQDQQGAFEEGHISAYKDGAGLDATYVAGAKTTGPVPTYVQPDGDGMDPVAVTKFYDGSLAPNTVYYGYILVDEDATGPVQGGPGQQFYFSEDEPVYGTWAYDLETPGTYALVVFATDGNGAASNTENYVVKAEKFTVQAADLSQCVVIAGEGDEVTPIVFNNTAYSFTNDNGASNALHIFLNGKEVFGNEIKATIVDAKTLKEVDDQEVTYAGTYKIRLDGLTGTIYEDCETDYIDLVIEKFDLGAAAVSLADVNLSTAATSKNYGTTIESVNYGEANWLFNGTESYIKITGYEPTPTGAGSYTATIGVDPNLAKTNEALANSITGTTTASYYVVDQVLGENNFVFKYDGHTAGSYTNNGIVIDYSAAKFTSEPGEPSNSFDATKITVELNNVKFEDGTTAVDPSEYELVVYNTETHEVGGTELLAESGSYELRAVLKAEAIDYQFAGSTRAIPVTVTQGEVADADVTFAYKGEAVTEIANGMMTYDGTDQLGDITITVKTTQGAVVDPADYTVTVKKENTEGKYVEVDGIVGAGDYQVIVTSDKYDITANSSIADAEVLEVTVDQLDPTKFRVAGLLNFAPSGDSTKPAEPVSGGFLPYTGTEIVPVIEYAVSDEYGNDVWATLPADQYKITKIKYNNNIPAAGNYVEVDAVEAVGTYTFDWADGYESAAAGQNFDLTGISGNIASLVVSDAKYFLDVPTDAWYYDEVLTAANNGWIKGFNNSVFYQPNESIKRGDVCVILARMAGVSLNVDENQGTTTEYFETPFSDVDGNLYYAEAIAWAANTGIVTGYTDGTNEFRAEQSVTREEFATMLARYAENMGIDTSAAAGAADGYADADQVSSWAADAVDWAVSADIMGVDTAVLNPAANISRAETAAMVVRL